MKKQRAKHIEEAMRIVWSSLESHLSYTHGRVRNRLENHSFHKRCVRDYARTIEILSQLY